MKILHLETGRHLYGGARQVLYLMHGLAARGIEQHLACVPGSELGDAARAEGHDVTELPYAGDLDMRLVYRLRALLRATATDVLHIHSRKGADTWGVLAAAGLDVSVIITRRVDNRDKRVLVRMKGRLSDEFVAISEGVKRALVADGVPARRITVIHSAVDLERYRPHQSPVRDLRTAYGLPADSLLVGVIAQLIPRKGHDYLFQALPRLLKRFPNLRLLLFGQGPLRGDLENSARRLGINPFVTFAGFSPTLANDLPQLNLVVHPALMEGLGVSLLEASACQVPIVASAVGGIPEVVHDHDNGILVPPADPEALLDAISTLLSDDQLRCLLGHGGRMLMEREFSIPQMANAYDRLYETIRHRIGK
ncbi:MAG: glycosyltransferase family 4 protein [Gammaproteobacteria bacterium]|nr:glycosyltransferase family 4 protein [Gammaproteobacteria bacterium]